MRKKIFQFFTTGCCWRDQPVCPLFIILPWTAAGALEEDVNNSSFVWYISAEMVARIKEFLLSTNRPDNGGAGGRTERSKNTGRWSMIWHQSFYWSKEIRGWKSKSGVGCACARERMTRETWCCVCSNWITAAVGPANVINDRPSLD